MTDMVARLFAVMRKEFLQIFRMKGIMPIVVGVPVLQMVIFSYAAVLDVRNITLGVIDRRVLFGRRLAGRGAGH